jgi:hypothetical protein
VTEGSFSDCNLDPIVRNIYAAFIALFEIGGIAEFVYRLSGVKDGKASAITDETWLNSETCRSWFTVKLLTS